MEEYKWYSGKYDRVFKEVMLKESNRDLLTMLIEHILKVKINNITILNVEKLMTNIHIRSQRLDLNLDTNMGKINVEVNSTYKKETSNRNFAFLADLYSHDILVGKEYNLNKKYIQINLSYGLNSNIDPIDIYMMRNNKGNAFIDNFIIYNINMDYYTNLFNINDTKKINDDIILVMLGQERDDLKKLSKNNKVVSKYMDELDEVNKNPEFREYMSYELEQEILRNTEHKIGFEEGIEQGIEKSKKEIVINLLKTDMNISEISKIVNLPKEEIIKIKDAK